MLPVALFCSALLLGFREVTGCPSLREKNPVRAAGCGLQPTGFREPQLLYWDRVPHFWLLPRFVENWHAGCL